MEFLKDNTSWKHTGWSSAPQRTKGVQEKKSNLSGSILILLPVIASYTYPTNSEASCVM